MSKSRLDLLPRAIRRIVEMFGLSVEDVDLGEAKCIDPRSGLPSLCNANTIITTKDSTEMVVLFFSSMSRSLTGVGICKMFDEFGRPLLVKFLPLTIYEVKKKLREDMTYLVPPLGIRLKAVRYIIEKYIQRPST